jgi:hypothetical protein
MIQCEETLIALAYDNLNKIRAILSLFICIKF